jgi:hypothetical protein
LSLRQLGGVGATHTFDNGNTISQSRLVKVLTQHRERIYHQPDEYSSFEVAVWDKDGEWVTRDFIPNDYQ